MTCYHWEPVIENLPPIYQDVRVKDHNGNIFTGMWTGAAWRLQNGGVSCDITAWLMVETEI